MNINTVNQTNFNANFIRNVNIKKFDAKSQTYKPFKASFVEFDPENYEDLVALLETRMDWVGGTYIGNIVEHASYIRDKYISPLINHIYVLTTQNDNFKYLDSDKILGMADMQSDSIQPDELRYLQVKPTQKHGFKNRTYRLVGSKILSELKKIYNEKITLLASYSAANFYEKHGFDVTDSMLLEYTWTNKRLKKK